MYNSILFYTFASNVLSPSMKGQRVLHFEIVLEKCQGSCCHRLIVITAGTQGTPSRTYLKAKREARVKGLGPHTSGSNLSTAGETCLHGYKPEPMGKYKGKPSAPWGSICTHITDVGEHFITYFQGHRDLEGALSFLPSSYSFSRLPVSLPSLPQNLSLCAFTYPSLISHCII